MPIQEEKALWYDVTHKTNQPSSVLVRHPRLPSMRPLVTPASPALVTGHSPPTTDILQHGTSQCPDYWYQLAAMSDNYSIVPLSVVANCCHLVPQNDMASAILANILKKTMDIKKLHFIVSKILADLCRPFPPPLNNNYSNG